MSERFIDALKSGKVQPPESAKTLGLTFVSYDADEMTMELEFDGRPTFANPIGIVQGGFLAAMLDDAMGLASAATMELGQFAPTLNLNVQFHRPAQIGKIQATGCVTMRGKSVLQLAGELRQEGKVLATGTATALIRNMRK